MTYFSFILGICSLQSVSNLGTYKSNQQSPGGFLSCDLRAVCFVKMSPVHDIAVRVLGGFE